MKLYRQLLIILGTLVYASCGSSEEAQTQEEPKEIVETATLEVLKDPCELLSKSDLESIDGFQKVSKGKVNLASSNTWRICDFAVNQRSLSVSLKRYDERIMETKGVERTYQTILDTKDELTRQEVSNTPGDQAIYTYGKKGVIYSYLLQWRHENHTEGMISISFPDEQNAKNVLSQLAAIAIKLEE